jgi:hypothetical protein
MELNPNDIEIKNKIIKTLDMIYDNDYCVSYYNKKNFIINVNFYCENHSNLNINKNDLLEFIRNQYRQIIFKSLIYKYTNKVDLDNYNKIMSSLILNIPYNEELYKPAIESLDFRPKRADDLFRPSPIIKDIWEYINKSKILLADITGLNANVIYELGLAHAI